MSYSEIMLDLETLDTRPGAVILSIGAVLFDPQSEELGAELHTVISRPHSEALGLTVSADTEAWWAKQSEQAKETLRMASSPEAVEPRVACEQFNTLVKMAAGGASKARIWGNGSDFDNVLLIALFEAAGVKPAWRYYNHRCFRTLKSLRQIELVREGTYHNALDDAKTQALHAVKIFKELSGA